MKISVMAPVLNEVQFIGYSVMAVLPYVHEIVYTLDSKSNDGTRELLKHLKDKYAGDKLKVLDHPSFDVHDMPAYNEAFNRCIRESTGDIVWFLHPDMVVLNPQQLEFMRAGPLAWYTNLTSYARDFNTVIAGRATKWKNMHLKKFGLHYYGGYGSQNEDFYHTDITGDSYRHHGEAFDKYPFDVADSFVEVAHYCELKPYQRRLDKMEKCLKTLAPEMSTTEIHKMATEHPRVSLEKTSEDFGTFNFEPTDQKPPEVFEKYKDELEAFTK